MLRETNNETENCCPMTGKLIYLTEQDAWTKRKSTAVVPYQCPHCKFWHHTHAKRGDK